MADIFPPPGFREVARDVFFDSIGPQNVHPSVQDGRFTSWETPYRKVVGVSVPGWKNPSGDKRWALKYAAIHKEGQSDEPR